MASEIKRLFKELKPGELFSCDRENMVENGWDRPFLWMRIGETDQAIFLPTGLPQKFFPETPVRSIGERKIEISNERR